jgi:hypothetical protein
MLTLNTQKASSHGWNGAPSRCDAAASVTTLSNSSSHDAASASRVQLRLPAPPRRSEPSAEALGPFQRTSAATLAPAASCSGGGGSPSARRTTRRTLNLRDAGDRGHRIILATIGGGPGLLVPRKDRPKTVPKTG